MTFDVARANAVFLAASKIHDATARMSYLDQQCGSSTDLRLLVDEMLRGATGAFANATAVFDPSIVTGSKGINSDFATLVHDDSKPSSKSSFSSTVIAGRYTLVRVIGEGGMGAVYLASQTEPVKRDVALKLIKNGMDSRSVLARFDAERQALAMMDHPNIARIYDGGVTQTGQPFFVMELVNGVPLTEYCDSKQLSVSSRLQLFVSVCQAVQHAHQKGIIHRDLKPGNILVTEVDGRPTPKVIDFGVAKATEQKLTEMSFSDIGAVVGTPAYMSPEQADPSSMDIDTRTDVYALGVMLYELLTGSPPLEAKHFKQIAILEMLRMVREVEPPRPSTKLSTGDTLPSVAANRSIDPSRLAKLLQGELDWVVMKALEKDRDRRYETANGFAQDIQRYLADEVVEARPPSRAYRLKKLVRRNKLQVIAACLVLSVLVVGIAGTTFGLFEAKKQQRRAEAGEKLAGERLVQVEIEKKRAEEEGQIALAVKEFLQFNLLALADTEAQADKLLRAGEASSEAKLNPTIRELLERVAKELAPESIDTSFPNQPLVQAEILRTVGATYEAIGEFSSGIEFLERSELLFRQHLGADASDTLESMNLLAMCYQSAGNIDKAVAFYEEGLKLRKAKLGLDHPDTLTSMINMASCYHSAGMRDKAVSFYEESVKLRASKFGPTHPDTLRSMNGLANCYTEIGELDKALPMLEEVLLQRRAKLGAEHPETLTSMNNLAMCYKEAGKLKNALPLWEETLRLRTAKLGTDHPSTLTSMNNLAFAYKSDNQLTKALALYEEALRLRKTKLGIDHPNTIKSMSNLGEAYRTAGKLDQAMPLLEEAFTLCNAKLGSDHPSTLISMLNLATGFKSVGRLPEALPLYEEALKLRKAQLGPDHPRTLALMGNLAVDYKDAGKFANALPLYDETLRLMKVKQGHSHPDTLTHMNNFALGYESAGKLEEAISLFEETLELRKTALGPDHSDTLDTMSNLGSAYQSAGKMDKAIPMYAKRLELQTSKLGPDNRSTLSTSKKLALAFELDKQFDEAEPLHRQRLALVGQKSGTESSSYAEALATLAQNQMLQKKWTVAEPLLLDCFSIREKRKPDARTTEVIDMLIELYKELNKSDEVLKWQTKREKYSVSQSERSR